MSSGATEARSESPPNVDRAEAVRLLERAHRTYRLAELVHVRRASGTVDSAMLAQRALVTSLRLLVRLGGEIPQATFSELTEQATRIARAENLLPADLTADLAVVAETSDRWQRELDGSPAEERMYDRAFVRAAEWLDATRVYLDQRLPPDPSRGMGRLVAVSAVVVAFGFGLLLGRRSVPVAQQAIRKVEAASTAPRAFVGRYFRDASFGELSVTHDDGAISFDWGSDPPNDSMPADEFSVRWDASLKVEKPGKYTFYLASDDGSRLHVDGALVVDNWGNHSELEVTKTLDLKAGPHTIRVEYFDHRGRAFVRLDWSSEHFQRRLVGVSDLR